MNILVLGGTYFIGRALVELLMLNKYSISLLNRGSRKTANSGVLSITADRHVYSELENGLRGKSFDVVIDLSGYNRNDVSLILDCLKGRIGQYIFCSSIAVCSKPPAYWPITEGHEKCSSFGESEYGYNKWLAEECLFQQSQKNSLAVSIVRPVYVYGPYDYSKRLDYFFSRILDGLPVVLAGNGENIVQFGYVYDLCRAIIALIGNKSAYGQAFNISGRELVTTKQFVTLVSQAIGRDVDLRFIADDSTQTDERSTLTSKHHFADISKAELLIGIVPNVSLTEGIKTTAQWYVNHRR